MEGTAMVSLSGMPINWQRSTSFCHRYAFLVRSILLARYLGLPILLHIEQIVLNTFLVKMFTGAVIDTFKRKQDAARGSSLLTPQQRIWVKNIRRVVTLTPLSRIYLPSSRWRWVQTLQSWCFRLLSWLWFERCITAAIIANLLFMALKHANQDLLFYRIETYSNAVFTVFFGAEAIVKVVGLGPRQYFSAIWNVFDFVLAVAGAASAIFAVGSVGIMLRLVRALRIVRLVKFSASLQVSFAVHYS